MEKIMTGIIEDIEIHGLQDEDPREVLHNMIRDADYCMAHQHVFPKKAIQHLRLAQALLKNTEEITNAK